MTLNVCACAVSEDGQLVRRVVEWGGGREGCECSVAVNYVENNRDIRYGKTIRASSHDCTIRMNCVCGAVFADAGSIVIDVGICVPSTTRATPEAVLIQISRCEVIFLLNPLQTLVTFDERMLITGAVVDMLCELHIIHLWYHAQASNKRCANMLDISICRFYETCVMEAGVIVACSATATRSDTTPHRICMRSGKNARK